MVSLYKKTTLKTEDIIYGHKPVIEAINSGNEVEKLYIQKNLQPARSDELRKLATEHKIPFQFVPKEKLNRLTRKNHQGIVAIISPIIYSNLEYIVPELFEQGKTPLLLVLDKITDVRNLGSIARSAECAGVDAILLPAKGSAMINADAVKTSAGALTKIKVCRVTSLNNSILYLKDSGLKIFGATEKSKNLYFETNYNIPAAIIMGSEEKGISPELLSLCDDHVKIPIAGEIGSLNVSVATGIILFEALRQRIK
ncbi:MAG: 23S rRNA (guanosine(2251)-2'-O)-methyltransferase RlmB [Bacteroidales bacterium]|nr:23S rRNA (guanosine(2251)-2'-O)-methyltransferase RlmB [Bacteroidales bacterium]